MTYMNAVACFPQYFMKMLQSQNVKRNTVKHIENNKEETSTNNEATAIETETKNQ